LLGVVYKAFYDANFQLVLEASLSNNYQLDVLVSSFRFPLDKPDCGYVDMNCVVLYGATS